MHRIHHVSSRPGEGSHVTLPLCQNSWSIMIHGYEHRAEPNHSFETFDADEAVLVVMAHGPAAMDNCTFLSQGTMNDWQQEWKTPCQWALVNELPYDGRSFLADGSHSDGKLIKAIAPATGTRHQDLGGEVALVDWDGRAI
ncbi:hypothetical protein GJ744_009897 [Endocarpon pusillum]|uniref:Uncharacterized protein n=1 Tax=Endocarpon pusillum TaxID=364733 RepID=A0A8H7E478_9EURO|nr:hypothetical protein GJ744_009897 [Endocarpon pusillum]